MTSQLIDRSQWRTREELARERGISVRTLYRRLNEGMVDTTRVGARVYYRWSASLLAPESTVAAAHGTGPKRTRAPVSGATRAEPKTPVRTYFNRSLGESRPSPSAEVWDVWQTAERPASTANRPAPPTATGPTPVANGIAPPLRAGSADTAAGSAFGNPGDTSLVERSGDDKSSARLTHARSSIRRSPVPAMAVAVDAHHRENTALRRKVAEAVAGRDRAFAAIATLQRRVEELEEADRAWQSWSEQILGRFASTLDT